MTDFGRDTLCLDSLLTGRMASGVRLVAQACYHRLITPRGMLRGGPDEGNYGLDLAGLCGQARSPELEAAMPVRIDNELRKDPRVRRTAVEVISSEPSPGQREWVVEVRALTAAGPFRLVLGVSGVTVKVLNLEAAA